MSSARGNHIPRGGWLIPLAARLAALKRLARDRRGVSLVETMFAVAFLTFFLVVAAQLFFISDLATYTLTAAYGQALDEVHQMDTQMRFELRHEVSLTLSQPAVPGMAHWVKYFNLSQTPGSYSVTREVMMAGGTYQGVGQSIYTWIDPFGPNHGGRRVLDVLKAFSTQLDLDQLHWPVWEKLLDYILKELIWETIMHALDYMLPPGTPDWIKEMIAEQLVKYIEDILPSASLG